MSSFFSPKIPAAIPPPPLPTREDPAIAERKREVESAARRRRGRQSTILTSGEGSLGNPVFDRPAAGKTVLG